MPIEKHDLLHELPEHRDAIHTLKTNNAHFARLFEEYHEVDDEVHRIEDNIETPSDQYATERKAKRLALKDELLKMIQEAS
ncbi:YdcH family protein [Verrucomicrobiaceae bacterium 227]